jgi:hypothetical protein
MQSWQRSDADQKHVSKTGVVGLRACPFSPVSGAFVTVHPQTAGIVTSSNQILMHFSVGICRKINYY